MHITAVRHGQTDGNISKIIQSRTGGKLTALGIEQAKTTAENLRGHSFERIYCSSLSRCQETLAYISKHHLETPIYISDQLVELDKGDLEGRQWEDLPEYFYNERHVTVRLPNGESWQDLTWRIANFLNTIYDPGVNSVLLVTHDGPLKVMHALLNNTPIGQAIQVSYSNAGVYELDMNHILTQDSIESIV